jgi:hemoglobin
MMQAEEKHDITTREDVKLLVDTFYDKVRNDELLSPIFNERIKDNWPKHLEIMYSFWNTVLLGEYEYQGTPFLKHAELPVEHMHFATWLRLFNEVIDGHFKALSQMRLNGGR